MNVFAESLRIQADKCDAQAREYRNLADMAENGLRYREPFEVCDEGAEEVELPRTESESEEPVTGQTAIPSFPPVPEEFKPYTIPWIILKFLRENYQEKFRYTEIASELRIELGQVASHVSRLKKFELIVREWIGNKAMIRANHGN